MAKTRDLRDPVDCMYFREELATNWCQKKFRKVAKQLEEFAPFSNGMTDLLQGLCYQHGWGVRKDRETARKIFSRLTPGQIVYFGHNVGFPMECEVLEVKEDRVFLQVCGLRPIYVSYDHRSIFPTKAHTTWDRCLARKWLNTDYLTDYFHKHERDLILKTTYTTPQNPFCSEKIAVKECTDKLYLLSIQEFMKYRGFDYLKARDITWTFTTKGPEEVYSCGEYRYMITERSDKYKTLYFGKDPDDLHKDCLNKSKGSYFRTAGSSEDKRAFYVDDFLFYEGETYNKIRNSDIQICYSPVFWVSLK